MDAKCCEECGQETVVFIYNSWERFAFSDQQMAWNYECKNEECGKEYCVSQPL